MARPRSAVVLDAARTFDAMTRVLFLDIDGVLNSHAYMQKHRAFWDFGDAPSMLDPDACARLERVLAATGAAVVISSSWRICTSLADIRGAIHSRGAPSARVIGKTPNPWTGSRRGHEIQRWLDAHDDIDSFAIVDDDADMEHLRGRLVQTHIADGLQDAHVEALVAMLASP